MKACSIGLRSGESFGGKNSLAPTERINLAHGFAFVAAQIVHDDDASRPKGWSETFFKKGPEALAINRHVGERRRIVRSWRRAARKVMVVQRSWGTLAIILCPAGLIPLRRGKIVTRLAKLGVSPVFSIHTGVPRKYLRQHPARSNRLELIGAPGTIRTSDPQIRSLSARAAYSTVAPSLRTAQPLFTRALMPKGWLSPLTSVNSNFEVRYLSRTCRRARGGWACPRPPVGQNRGEVPTRLLGGDLVVAFPTASERP